LNASAGHWKRCGGPHVTRGSLIAHLCLRQKVWIQGNNLEKLHFTRSATQNFKNIDCYDMTHSNLQHVTLKSPEKSQYELGTSLTSRFSNLARSALRRKSCAHHISFMCRVLERLAPMNFQEVLGLFLHTRQMKTSRTICARLTIAKDHLRIAPW